MKIVTTPNPILTTPSRPVLKIDKQVLDLIDQMKKTLLSTENPKGVGLAAPQIGINLCVFITKPFPKSAISVFINPQIVSQSADLTHGIPSRENKLEGCLSIPGVWGQVKRHQSLKLKYLTPDGKSHTQQFTGFMATIIQHEIDHLTGRLFPSRVLEQKGKLYQARKNKEGKEALEELKI